MSHEIPKITGAEALITVEGNTCGAVMRGPVALSGSKASSRKKRSRRNLGDLLIDQGPLTGSVGPWREGEES